LSAATKIMDQLQLACVAL